MTVWTIVSLDDVNEWLSGRGLERACHLSPVEEGVEDSVYRLDLIGGGHACLRIFERTEPLGPITIAQRLGSLGLPTCPPIQDKAGGILRPLQSKQACLFPWIEGAWLEKPANKQIDAIGAFMGKMAKHGAEVCGGWRRENPRGWPWFVETANSISRVLEDSLRLELLEEVAVQHAFWTEGAGVDLPRGPIHADLFRNNVLFRPDGTLGAVIDWGFCASNAPLLYDLAIVANDWCLLDDEYSLDAEKLGILMHAREEVLPLLDSEKAAWPMALRVAALRFYLSRLVDFYLPRDGNGKKRDPFAFCSILRSRKAL